jgi:hypothetical protein
MEETLRKLATLSAAGLLIAGAAIAQTTPPASPGTGGPTGSSNPAVSTTGNAPSSTNPSGTANIVAASALEKGAKNGRTRTIDTCRSTAAQVAAPALLAQLLPFAA